MKIAVIGATGFVGQNLVKELTSRKQTVIAIARNIEKLEASENLIPKQADVNNIAELSEALKGADVVINAFNAGWTNPNLYNDFLQGSKDIQEAVKKSGVKRFITIGGAGSLYIDGKQLVDGSDFPAEYKAGATAARDYLNIIKEEKDLDWTFFSPAIEMHQGITTGRTGQYRLGLENPVSNNEGRSILSGEDLAVVIADEVESNKHIKQRFTAAY